MYIPSVWTNVPHYSITQDSFTACNPLCAPPVHPLSLQLLAATDIFLSPLFHLFQKAVGLESHSMPPSRTGFFRGVICTEVSSMSLHGLRAHFFLSLDDVPLHEPTEGVLAPAGFGPSRMAKLL